MNFKKIAEEIVPNSLVELGIEEKVRADWEALQNEIISALRQAWLDGARKMQERMIVLTTSGLPVKELFESINSETLMEEK